MSEIDDIFAKPCGGVHNNIEFATSLTGSPNAPETPTGANSPGLESNSIFGNTKGQQQMKKHWLLIIVAILLGLWAWNYFGVGAAVSA